MILLRHESFELGLAPRSGGTVTHFRHDGTDLLRAASGDQPTESAAFPMIPFCGRIAHGRFSWDGRPVQLASNFPPEPHAIHGHGWQSGWDVDVHTPDFAALSYHHVAGDWPWAYRATQTFRLCAKGLAVTLSLTNMSGETMPAGIGWHPYFPARGALIAADTRMIWEGGPGNLPLVRRIPVDQEDLRAISPVEALSLDTPFETAGGPVTLTWPTRGTSLRMLTDSVLRFLVVYTPPGERFFCVEPTSHIPNMVNLAASPDQTGHVALAPAQTLSGAIRLEVSTLVRRESPA